MPFSGLSSSCSSPCCSSRAGCSNGIASAQRASGVQAPTFEVDPLWPRPLPNHWVLGQTIGVAVDAQDHVWIVHRGDASLNITTEGVHTQGPTWTVTSDQPWLTLPGGSRGGIGTGALVFQITGAVPDAAGHRPTHRQRHGLDDAEGTAVGVLQGRAARARIRSRRQSRRPLGRSGRRVRMAWNQPRHHGRPQGQRLDWRQRSGGCADPQVHQAGEVPAAGGPSGQERRQPRHGELLARREGHRRSEDERGLCRRRLW